MAVSCRARWLALLLGAPLITWGQFSESPATVAPGGWLMETDVVSVAFDRHTPSRDGVHYRSTVVGYVQVTTGITPTFDFQLGFDSWREERARDALGMTRVRGTGELYVRAKWRIWERGDAAIAVLPYWRVADTADIELRPRRAQFGVVLPWSTQANDRWWLGGQFQADWLDDGGAGRDEWFAATLVGGRALTVAVGFYLEAVTYVSRQATRDWAAAVGGGFTWQVAERFSWDLGFLVGCTRSAPDFNPALRFVWEF